MSANENPSAGLDSAGAGPKFLAVAAKPPYFTPADVKSKAVNPWARLVAYCSPRAEMLRIQAANPNLTINGYAVRLWGAEEFAALTEPDHLKQFLAARQWLRQFPKTKKPNPNGTSYGLKHVAELEIGYLSNGIMIAAALAEGYPVKRIPGTPNAEIGIDNKAWRARRRA